MSAVRQHPQQQALPTGRWLRATPGDRRSAVRSIIPSQRHAVTLFLHVMQADAANENGEREGGSECHLGIYIRG
jgi:hypothetical protein